MLCRCRLKGRVTASSFLPSNFQVIVASNSLSAAHSWLELLNPVFEQDSLQLRYHKKTSVELTDHVEEICTVSDGDSKRESVFVATKEGNILYYRVAESSMISVGNFKEAHTSNVLLLDYCSKNQLLYSGGKDGTVKVWDIRSGYNKANKPCFSTHLGEHQEDTLWSLRHGGLSEGYKFYIGTDLGNIFLYDTRMNKSFVEKLSLSGSVSTILEVSKHHIVVSTLDTVYLVNFLLLRDQVIYNEQNATLVGMSINPFRKDQVIVANHQRKLLLLGWKTTVEQQIGKQRVEGLYTKTPWTSVTWHSQYPVYLAKEYDSFQVGLVEAAVEMEST